MWREKREIKRQTNISDSVSQAAYVAVTCLWFLPVDLHCPAAAFFSVLLWRMVSAVSWLVTYRGGE